MKKILISSFDMEVGGVERSLLSMLNNFDYQHFDVDLFLYSQSGDFLNLLPSEPLLLKEIKQYKTVRQSIKTIFKNGMWSIAIARLLAKKFASLYRVKEKGYIQTQLIWKYCLPFFPKNETEYDIAISYLWPHHYVARKVKAKQKIAWIHTDYSTITTNIKADIAIWKQFDHIVSISEDCAKAFIKKYPMLEDKLLTIENITAPKFIKKMSLEPLKDFVFSNKYFNLLSVGRLCHPKAFDKAVKVLRLLHDKGFKDIKWFIIGEGPDQSLLDSLINQHDLSDSFILLGKINNPYPYMKDCSLYVQPSRYEGKAVAVTEAKILAKPILIANYATAPSQIAQNIDGIISGNSVNEIAESIIYLYRNPEKRASLSQCCASTDYNNSEELEKLYSILNATRQKT